MKANLPTEITKICHSALEPCSLPTTLRHYSGISPLYSHKEQTGKWVAQTTAMAPKVTCQAAEWAQPWWTQLCLPGHEAAAEIQLFPPLEWGQDTSHNCLHENHIASWEDRQDQESFILMSIRLKLLSGCADKTLEEAVKQGVKCMAFGILKTRVPSPCLLNSVVILNKLHCT